MHSILDERAALPSAQGVLLWSMRAWVLGLARSLDMGARIRGAFAGLDAEDAAASLTGFMEALDDGGIRTIDIGRMCSLGITADERLLLGVFSAVQAGQASKAAAALRGMVAARSVPVALDRAEDVASALLDAGQQLASHAKTAHPQPAFSNAARH